MEFGIQFFPAVGPDQKPAEQYWREALELTQLAERLGFTNVRTVEHYFLSYGGYSPDPLIFLSAAAAVTRSIRLITGAVLPVFNNPLKLAGQIGMVDAISGGRLEVGFARAFLPHEFARFGISMDESRARFDEGLEQVRRLLEEQKVTARGRFHSFENATSLPRPTQKPRPPFWIAALSTKESFENAGTLGHYLMGIPLAGAHMASLLQTYRDAWTAAGRWRPRQGDAGVPHVLRGYLGEGRRRRARAAQSISEIDRGRGLGLDVGGVLARLSQLPENDREPLARDVRVAGRQRPGLDRHARGDPKRNRGLSQRRRRLRVRVAAGEFRHDRSRRGRGVDAVVRARGDAALCPRLSDAAVASPSTVPV